MEEPTKKRRTVTQDQGIDTIKLQNLPEQLIHYILHFLPCKDATKLSVLSKDFYSYWLSFPVLDFDYDFFREQPDSDETFFTFIERMIQLRGPRIMGSLQKLSLSYNEEIESTNPYPYRTSLDALLDFAVQNNCKEIIFNIGVTVPYYIILEDWSFINENVSYESLLPLFSSKFLTVLKLTGLKFTPIPETFITCPKLEELLICCCEGFQNLTVSSPSLKQVEVKRCNGMREFHVEEGEKLQRFIFEGIRTYHELQQCEVNLPVCDSLRYLHLTKVKVLAENVNEVITEFLYLGRCDLPENTQIYNPHIKVLEMENNYKVENLVLYTPTLESFRFKASDRQACELNILACLALRILKLIEVTTITDEWLRSVMSRLVCLKEVEIRGSSSLEKLDFKTNNLEKFSLYECSNLREVFVDVPNLLEFNYKGKLGVSPMLVLSAKCSGNIRLSRNTSDNLLWFENMTHFLRCFDHFKDLTFSCNTAEDMIFPRAYVWPNKLPPLYDVKHVKFHTEDMPNIEIVTPLIECLLWLVPKPLTLALSSRFPAKTSTIKLGYGRIVEARKVEECCSGVPIKCWRHFVLKVKFEGFDEPVKKCLEKFFAPYLRYYGVNY